MMYNFDLGYCQGMSDIASVLVQTLNDEVEAFYCFVGFMNRIHSNFDLNQYGMKKQLAQLRTILQFLDHDLCAFLEQKDSLNMYFCFRWILIWFKREFQFEEIKILWEILWTGKPCENFHLLIAAGILLKNKKQIMQNDLSFTEILKFVNNLSEELNVFEIVQVGNAIFDLISNLQKQNLPNSITSILFP